MAPGDVARMRLGGQRVAQALRVSSAFIRSRTSNRAGHHHCQTYLLLGDDMVTPDVNMQDTLMALSSRRLDAQ
jgi:hypothetical protein